MPRRSTPYRLAGFMLAVSVALAGAAAADPAQASPMEAKPEPKTPTLRIGDTAAALSPEILWLRNMLVPEFLEGTVYIVYLWSPDSPNSMGSLT